MSALNPASDIDGERAIEAISPTWPEAHVAIATKRHNQARGLDSHKHAVAAPDALIAFPRGDTHRTPTQRQSSTAMLEPVAPALLPVGKIALPELSSSAYETLGMPQYEAPQGAVELAIAEIWKELLGLEQVGRRDHFFELGGRSSLAMSLFYRLRQRMRVSVGMRELFQEPVLHGFAATVSERIDAAACSM